jgi:hypothetical protein
MDLSEYRPRRHCGQSTASPQVFQPRGNRSSVPRRKQ